jgi:hypothetical protein
MDRAASTHFVAGIGKPVAQSALVPQHEFLESRFYPAWARPQSLIHCVPVTIDKRGTKRALCGVSRHQRDGYAGKQLAEF